MSTLGKNIGYNLGAQIFLLLLGFLSIKYIHSRLGEDVLGVIYFTSTLNVILSGVLEMGLSSTAVREISAQRDAEPGYVHDLVRTVSLIYWGFFVLAAIAIFLATPFLVENWLRLRELPPVEAVLMVRVLGISTFLAFPCSIYCCVLDGCQQFRTKSRLDVLIGCFFQGGTLLLLLLFGGKTFAIVVWTAACTSLRTILFAFAAGRLVSLSALVPGFHWMVVKRNLRYSSRMFFISACSVLYMNLDKMIISKLMPVGFLGYYAVIQSHVSKGLVFVYSACSVALPSFSALLGDGQRAPALAQYRKLQALISFGMIPLFAVFPFVAIHLYSYLFGTSVAQGLVIPVILLTFSYYLQGILTVPYIFSLASGRPGIAARQQILNLLVIAPVTMFFVFKYQMTGAAASLLLLMLIHFLYSMRRIARECLGMPVWRAVLPLLCSIPLSIVTYGTAFGVLWLVGWKTISGLSAGYCAATIIYCALAYRVAGEEIRQTLQQNLQALRKTLSVRSRGFFRRSTVAGEGRPGAGGPFP